MNLIEYIEKESGMNCPEWLRETIERYATWSQTYSNMVKDAYSNMVEDAVGEVPYAKRTAETTQNVPNDDLISRKAAIEIANDIRDCITVEGYWAWLERLKRLPSAQPSLDEWCTDCKEYDQERHCCPRFNRVIRETLREAQPERENAEWLKNNNGTYSCSKCQSWIPEEQRHYARYCLYCGSKMERRTDGEKETNCG